MPFSSNTRAKSVKPKSSSTACTQASTMGYAFGTKNKSLLTSIAATANGMENTANIGWRMSFSYALTKKNALPLTRLSESVV